MKKIISLLIFAICAFSLFACAKAPAEIPDEPVDTPAQETEKIERPDAVTADEAFSDVDFSDYAHLKLFDSSGVTFENFEGVDSYGNKVTQDIFGDYDVTAVNLWTTWCPYCLIEMPHLNELYKQLPENMNLVGYCADAEEMPDDFSYIMENLPHDYTVIAADRGLNSATEVTGNITGYPTTLFVDKNGAVIGQIAGLPLGMSAKEIDDSVIDGYKKLFKEALKKIEE